MSAPRVSIVVPTHNRAALLEQTLDSVEALDFADFECIVVDDASQDRTAETVSARAQRDARFRLERIVAGSAAGARNHGLSIARGEFVLFLDSDDLLPPDRLGWQVEAMTADPDVVLVYGDTWQFSGDDPSEGSLYLADVVEKPQGAAFEALLGCSSIYAPLIRARTIRAAGGFDVTLPSAEDWDMWLTLARAGRVVYRPRITLHYRLHAGNKSKNTVLNCLCAQRVAEKHLRSLPFRWRTRLRRRVRAYFARVYSRPLEDFAWAAATRREWSQVRSAWRMLSRLSLRRVLRSRTRAAYALWSWLPLRGAPFWTDRGQA